MAKWSFWQNYPLVRPSQDKEIKAYLKTSVDGMKAQIRELAEEQMAKRAEAEDA